MSDDERVCGCGRCDDCLAYFLAEWDELNERAMEEVWDASV